MLQDIRSLAKYIWVLVAVAFIGGFLIYETSGLVGQGPVTRGTPVAVVNGRDILYDSYVRRVQGEIQAQQQQMGRTLNQDDTRRIENAVFDQMVTDVLLEQEYRRRGITVTDDELREFARYVPPPWLINLPELQTDGRFDPDKYGRLLASPIARQQGILLALEQYYRSEVPREKLFDQVATGVYVTDAELWRGWRDLNDSTQVSFVAMRPQVDTAAARAIPDAELRRYFEQHRRDFDRPGTALLTIAALPRVISTADTAAARSRAVRLRSEIVGGASFEDVARRESADTASGTQGGDLGRGVRGRFIPEFEQAAYALRVREVSQPVLTQFGYHLIRVDERRGDTLSLRHILVSIEQSDTAAALLDRRADSLAALAASSDQPGRLDEAARRMGLELRQAHVFEDEPAFVDGRVVPSASAWAFGGARVGETSELFDDENGYYVARLDSLTRGGVPRFEAVREEVRQRVAIERALDQLVASARQVASVAAASTLEAAAQQHAVAVERSPMFTRGSFVPGLGQMNEALGAAFSIPVGAVGAPVRTSEAVFVLRVDRRVRADSAAFQAELPNLRQQRLTQVRQQRVQMYLRDLREAARIDDRRLRIQAALRRQEV